ncbi:unnamed protein product [Schistosoma margrebowiei]|uniref:Protein FAM154B n=1 Tax=Schistosoma margrebowiei TaxID=48269 RepID=A0AA85APE8_9TREM|nr:unnamed protein product [Schistosoma margrebowiei]
MRNESSKLCICQICNCGRHKCPHQKRKTQITKPCEISEYTTQYITHKLTPVESCKPPHKGVQAEGHMASDTTHRVDFVPHPLSIQNSCRKEAQYQPPQGTFDGLTTYTKEYTGKSGQLVVPVKPTIRKGSTAKFDGEATYTADYRPWKLERRELATGRESNWPKPNLPFSGTPTYTSDYVAYNAKPPISCKPMHCFIENQTPFPDSTDYRDSYRTLDLSERARPIKNVEHTQKVTVPMEHLSTHMHDYYWKTMIPSASCKPEYTGIQNNEPFHKDTTHRIDYKAWELTDRTAPISANHASTYPEPLGKMCSDTTYNKDYIPFGLQNRQAIHQVDKIGRGVELPPFQGVSDYKDSYRCWTIEPPVKGLGRESTYTIPNVKFEGKSTTNDHYVPHLNYRPPESFKPHGQVTANQTPFDDATLYRMEYTPKHLEPCPASLLNTGLSKYVYAETSDTGHEIYRRASNSSSLTNDQYSKQHLITIPNEPLTVAN